MTYRKIGGIHWLAIGRLRFSFCVVRKPRPYKPLPHAITLAELYDNGLIPNEVRTYLGKSSH